MVLRQFLWQYLERDRSIELLLVDLEHTAHTARTDEFLNIKFREQLGEFGLRRQLISPLRRSSVAAFQREVEQGALVQFIPPGVWASAKICSSG